MCIDRYLDSTVVEIRKAINEIIKVDPCRHASWLEPIINRGNAEEKDFLSGDVNQLGQQRREELWQPRSTGENEFVGENSFAGYRLK